MEIRGFHEGRVAGANARNTTSNVLKRPNSTPGVGSNNGSDSLTKSSEFLRLAEALHRVAEVRAEVVARAAQKLSSGVYDSRDAAEQTAKSILNHR